MNEREIWEDIPDYEGIYQASTFGRIRSVDRLRACKNDNTFLCKGKILKPCKQNSGYLLVWLRKDGKTRAICVHRLIALTFLANPNKYEQINHIDGNKTNGKRYDTRTI